MSDDEKTEQEQIYESIGRFVVFFNKVEYAIGDLICLYLFGNTPDHQSVCHRITTKLTFKDKLDLLQELITERLGKKHANKFKEIYSLIYDEMEYRNEIIHSEWWINMKSEKTEVGETKILNLVKASRKNKRNALDWDKGFIGISTEEINSHSDNLEKLNFVIKAHVSDKDSGYKVMNKYLNNDLNVHN
ncbi:MAG: hypothetical protein WD335_03630 [Candidatus Paceibacterota bacterium]